jgi:hypothetical protein
VDFQDVHVNASYFRDSITPVLKIIIDAAAFIGFICQCTRSGTPLQLNEFKRELLD